jgi:hypothetical protein
VHHSAVSRLKDVQRQIAARQKNNVEREERDSFGPR